MIRLLYDTSAFDFHGLVCYLLEVSDLSRLHETTFPGVSLELRRGLVVKKLYDRRTEGLDELLHKFVSTVVAPVIGPIVSYQVRPCYRVHMHGHNSISVFHQDGDWGQMNEVQNVWIPFTRVWGSNSLWLESRPGQGDYSPVELKYGEAVIFGGAQLRHGSVANDTGFTRVSADLRVLPRQE